MEWLTTAIKADVRFGSLADVCSAKGHVRFAPNSDRESGFPQKVMSPAGGGGPRHAEFAIVASGPNSASPHHEPGERVIQRGRADRARHRRPARGLLVGHDAHAVGHRATQTSGRPTSSRKLYEVLQQRAGGAAARRVKRRACRAEDSMPSAADRSPRPASASSSSIAPGTASASRATRIRTSLPATTRRSRSATLSASSPASTSTARYGARIEDIVAVRGRMADVDCSSTSSSRDLLRRARLMSVEAANEVQRRRGGPTRRPRRQQRTDCGAIAPLHQVAPVRAAA